MNGVVAFDYCYQGDDIRFEFLMLMSMIYFVFVSQLSIMLDFKVGYRGGWFRLGDLATT